MCFSGEFSACILGQYSAWFSDEPSGVQPDQAQSLMQRQSWHLNFFSSFCFFGLGGGFGLKWESMCLPKSFLLKCLGQWGHTINGFNIFLHVQFISKINQKTTSFKCIFRVNLYYVVTTSTVLFPQQAASIGRSHKQNWLWAVCVMWKCYWNFQNPTKNTGDRALSILDLVWLNSWQVQLVGIDCNVKTSLEFSKSIQKYRR